MGCFKYAGSFNLLHFISVSYVRLCQLSALEDMNFRSQLLTATAWLHMYTQKHTCWGKLEKQIYKRSYLSFLCFPPSACEHSWESCSSGCLQRGRQFMQSLLLKASCEFGSRLRHRGSSVWGAELDWPHNMREWGSVNDSAKKNGRRNETKGGLFWEGGVSVACFLLIIRRLTASHVPS